MWNRFNAKKVVYDGITFDSKAEGDRYLELKGMQQRGEISYLCCDKSKMHFEIIPKQMRTVTVQLKTKVKHVERLDESSAVYTPDFTYMRDGVYVIEEVKSKATKSMPDYVLRRKLMKILIRRHNEENPTDPWVFSELVAQGKRKKKKVM